MKKNRFSRLVVLKRLKEERAAAILSQAANRCEVLREDRKKLQQETRQGQEDLCNSFSDPSLRIPRVLYGNYLQGQNHRDGHLVETLNQASQEMGKAQQGWQLARTEVRQLEKLEEKVGSQLKKEQQKAELAELDRQGIIRYGRNDNV
ncbi:hypothetical protein ACQZV8_14000 [Magnetococcales bacterium HHB-1]